MESPTLLSNLTELMEKWKAVLELLVPGSIVEPGNKAEKEFFTWSFVNTLSSTFKRSVVMRFYLNSTVVAESQSSGETIETFSTFKKAEKWIYKYLEFPPLSNGPSSVLGTLPSLEDRTKNYQDWRALLEKLIPYGVSVDSDSELALFTMVLPTAESVVKHTVNPDEKFEGDYHQVVSFYPGEDWGKIFTEKIINPLKELYALSGSEVKIPEFID